MKGARERLKREHNDRAWLAWTIVQLPGSKKRFADLIYPDRPRKPRTWQDEFASFDSWAKGR